MTGEPLLVREEIKARKALQAFKKKEASKAYEEKKAWDYGHLGTKQVLDANRTTDRRKKKGKD